MSVDPVNPDPVEPLQPVHERPCLLGLHPEPFAADIQLEKRAKRRARVTIEPFGGRAIVHGHDQIVGARGGGGVCGGEVAAVQEHGEADARLANPHRIGEVHDGERIRARVGDNPGRLRHPEPARIALERGEDSDPGSDQAAQRRDVVSDGGGVDLHPVRSREPLEVGCPFDVVDGSRLPIPGCASLPGDDVQGRTSLPTDCRNG